jgi:hypothetical protein
MKNITKSDRRHLITLFVLGAFLISLPLTGSAVITSVQVIAGDFPNDIATAQFPFSNGFDTTGVIVQTDPGGNRIFGQWFVNTIAGNADPAAVVNPCPGHPSGQCLSDSDPSTSPNGPPNQPNENGPEFYILTIRQANTPGPGQPVSDKISIQISSHIPCGASNTTVLVGAGVSVSPACINFAALASNTFSFTIENVSAAGFSFDDQFSLQIAGTSGSVTDGPGEDQFESPIVPGTTTTTSTTTTTTSTTSTTSTTTATTTEPPPTIPTTGEWGMMIFAAALLGFMAWMIQARRSIK